MISGAAHKRRLTLPPQPKVIHLRRDTAPWVIGILSECGVHNPRRAMRWDEFIVNGVEQPNVKPHLCKTCLTRFNRREMRPDTRWDISPSMVLVRTRDRDEFDLDLWALGELYRAHADEFQVIRHIIKQRKKIN